MGTRRGSLKFFFHAFLWGQWSRPILGGLFAANWILGSSLFAQSFSAEEYRKALWMTTRFYGAQRSGEGPNWLVMDHKSGVDFVEDADDGYDLSGGWHDCGDHVKFGQTQFYSAYMILKAYAVFPRGFDDHYSFDYAGYGGSGDFSWEGGRGQPNGIPDILDEIKYATDYFIKAARDDNTFYYQVGNGNYDHKNWVTSVHMATLGTDEGGSPRPLSKNPNGASMASFCGATLALMSRVYQKFDPQYAEICLRHARHAYAYAKAHPGSVGADFYPANAKWQDDFITMAVELYLATGEESFRGEALNLQSQVGNHFWSLNYNNNDDLASYNLIRYDIAPNHGVLDELVESYRNSLNGEGVSTQGDSWGILRYAASQAFAAALHVDVSQNQQSRDFVFSNVDYILGENSASRSFVVGFGDNAPRHPHHRNVYLNDDNVGDTEKNDLPIPERNAQFGMLVGGDVDPSGYPDDVNTYSSSEGCIDYNAGLVGALGFILSELAPVDTTRFGTAAVKLRSSGTRMGPPEFRLGKNGSVVIQTGAKKWD